MDDGQVGRAIRAVRIKRRWRQRDLSALARVSQQAVSLVERGRFDLVGLKTVRRVAKELDVTVNLTVRWRDGDLFELLDAEHALLVDAALKRLTAIGWTLIVEYSFNHFGDRGSVDIVGWHPGRRSLLIIEVKSRIVDVQELLGTLDRKVRVVPTLLRRERGWHATSVGRLLVLPSTKRERHAIERHAAVFSVALPARATTVRRWIADPYGSLQGIWFVADTTRFGGNCAPSARVRVSTEHRGIRAHGPRSAT